MVSTQLLNMEMVDLLSAEFQRRYEPNFAWVNALSAFTMLPGLRGFWPMSSMGSLAGANSDTIDLSGQGRDLTNVGQAEYGQSGLIPYANFDGTNDYLMRTDEAGLDIIGTETYLEAASRGLTLGGWFNFATLPTTGNWGILGKWRGTGNQLAYLLFILNGTSLARFSVSPDGIASPFISSSYTLSANTWYFIVGRFDPSTELAIMVNGTTNKDTNVAAIPASIFNSTADYNVMAYNNGAAANRNQGLASLNFLCAAYLPDYQIEALFQQTRAIFGV